MANATGNNVVISEQELEQRVQRQSNSCYRPGPWQLGRRVSPGGDQKKQRKRENNWGVAASQGSSMVILKSPMSKFEVLSQRKVMQQYRLRKTKVVKGTAGAIQASGRCKREQRRNERLKSEGMEGQAKARNDSTSPRIVGAGTLAFRIECM